MNITELYSIFLQHPVVSTDTRNLPAGCMFFALKGAHFDANQFAEQALAGGAAYAVIDNPQYRVNDRCILVPDVLKALQDLANYHRRQFDIPVIAIGGSNGKTTTKELVSSILSAHYPCHYTRGNYNNHIGVPLTLLTMPKGTEVAIIEMGTNQPGDITELCRITQPTHGLLTNIGKEHLEGFGSLAGVKKAEGELYDYLAKHHGCAFVNLSEKYLDAMSKKVPMRVGYYQIEPLRPEPGTIEVQLLEEIPRVKVAFLSDDGPRIEITTQLFGRHNFQNIMTAIALGVYFKVPAGKIKEALEAYSPRNNRSQILPLRGATVLLDAYNANPSSMRPALQSLMGMPGKRHIAILGDMLELGADSHKEHEELLRYATKLKVDQIVLVGKEFGKTDFGHYKALHFPDNTAVKTWLDSQDIQDTAILIKGSRGIKLEVVVG